MKRIMELGQLPTEQNKTIRPEFLSSWFSGLFRRVVWWLDIDVSEGRAAPFSLLCKPHISYRVSFYWRPT
jgi:hypothetical protein